MVFFAIFEYRNEDYLEPWNKKVGITASLNHRSTEGSKMLSTLKKFHMDKYEDDGFKYLRVFPYRQSAS